MMERLLPGRFVPTSQQAARTRAKHAGSSVHFGTQELPPQPASQQRRPQATTQRPGTPHLATGQRLFTDTLVPAPRTITGPIQNAPRQPTQTPDYRPQPLRVAELIRQIMQAPRWLNRTEVSDSEDSLVLSSSSDSSEESDVSDLSTDEDEPTQTPSPSSTAPAEKPQR